MATKKAPPTVEPERFDLGEQMSKLAEHKSGLPDWKFQALRVHIRSGLTLDQAFDKFNEDDMTIRPVSPPVEIPPAPPVARKRKKTSTLTSVAAIKTNDGTIAVEAAQPKGATFHSKGELDEFGFGCNTQVSFVIAHICEGSFTKQEITDKFVEQQLKIEQAKGSMGFASKAMKISSLSVIFSDIVKPMGTYHASRSLIINKAEDTQILSFDQARLEIVKKAIAGGILVNLKGYTMSKHPDKVQAILKKFNLPGE